MIIECEGCGWLKIGAGVLELTPTHVVIRKHKSQGEYRAAYDVITNVNVTVTKGVDPFIQVLTASDKVVTGQGLENPDHFPSCIHFKLPQLDEIKRARDEIERRIAAAKSSVAGISTAGELEKLVALHQSGALSVEEFALLKRRLLGG